MRTATALAAAALTIALAAAASAQDTTRVESFDDELVSGTLDSPMVDHILMRTRSRRVSFVRPRGTYVPELIKSIENL